MRQETDKERREREEVERLEAELEAADVRKLSWWESPTTPNPGPGACERCGCDTSPRENGMGGWRVPAFCDPCIALNAQDEAARRVRSEMAVAATRVGWPIQLARQAVRREVEGGLQEWSQRGGFAWVHGNYRSGKTSAAICATWSLFRVWMEKRLERTTYSHKEPLLYVKAADLVSAIQADRKGQELRRFQGVPLLILDDVAATSRGGAVALLSQVLRERLDSRRSTIMVSLQAPSAVIRQMVETAHHGDVEGLVSVVEATRHIHDMGTQSHEDGEGWI